MKIEFAIDNGAGGVITAFRNDKGNVLFLEFVDDVDSQLPYQKAANCRIKNRPTVASDFC